MTLPKNFTVLAKPRKKINKVKRKCYGLEILMNFPGAWKALGSRWMQDSERLKGGELYLLSDEGEFRHFKVWIEYCRKGIAAREYTVEKAEFELWQHKNGFSLVINAPRVLAELTSTFLSVAIYRDPFAVRVRRIEKEDFLALLRYARSLGGKVTVLQLRHVKTEDMGNLSVLKISGRDMEGPNVDKLVNEARKVTRIGFQIPNLGGTEFRFWVGHWGGGTIYFPSMRVPHHAWNLIRFFEDVLKTPTHENVKT
jgi:hypothetical protein